MKEFGKRFLDEHVAAHCKLSTQYEYCRCVDLFITPKLGTLKAIDVTRADVVELHQGLKETPYQANRVLGVLSIMFTLPPHGACDRTGSIRAGRSNATKR